MFQLRTDGLSKGREVEIVMNNWSNEEIVILTACGINISNERDRTVGHSNSYSETVNRVWQFMGYAKGKVVDVWRAMINFYISLL